MYVNILYICYCLPAMLCPAHSHYELCSDVCSAACPGLTSIIQCPKTCTEGCACDRGFLFNGQLCVEHQQCGCYEQGRTFKVELLIHTRVYESINISKCLNGFSSKSCPACDCLCFQAGEVTYLNHCEQKCQCDPGIGLTCEKSNCPNGTECLLREGVWSCSSQGQDNTPYIITLAMYLCTCMNFIRLFRCNSLSESECAVPLLHNYYITAVCMVSNIPHLKCTLRK